MRFAEAVVAAPAQDVWMCDDVVAIRCIYCDGEQLYGEMADIHHKDDCIWLSAVKYIEGKHE